MGPRCDWDDEGLATADWNPVCSCIWREGGTCNCKMCQRFFYLRLRLLFSLKPKEMAKMRLLAIWIDQRQNFEISKKIVISHIRNEIFKQKNVTGSGLEGTPKLLKAFFSRLFLCENYATLEVPTLADFHSLV